MTLIEELSERVPGRAFGPGSSEYDSGRTVFYGPGEPEVVLRPTTADEVAAAVRAAVAADLTVAVRSGGHGSMPAEGGAVIDLAEFDTIEIGEGGLVTVGAGAHWGDVAAALAPHGLGITSGDTLDVGVGGLALGGGVGWLVRTHGLTVDLVRRGRTRDRRGRGAHGRCAVAPRPVLGGARRRRQLRRRDAVHAAGRSRRRARRRTREIRPVRCRRGAAGVA